MQVQLRVFFPKWSMHNDAWCSDCGEEVEFDNARVRSKRKGTWHCKQCGVKLVQLYRGFGSWPPAEFEALHEELQQRFYNDVKHKHGDDAIKIAKHILESHESHDQWYENGGSFLPLGVWSSRGFDAENIRANSNAEDIRQDRALGTVST